MSHPARAPSEPTSRGARRRATHCGPSAVPSEVVAPAARLGEPAARAMPSGRRGISRVRRRAPGLSRPPIRPGSERSLTEDVEAGRHASGPHAEQDHPPRSVGRLDQVGVTRVLNRAVGAPMAHDRVGRCTLPGAGGRRCAGDRDARAASVPPSAITRYHFPRVGTGAGLQGIAGRCQTM